MERTSVPDWAGGEERAGTAATERQLSYIRDLIAEREIPEDKLAIAKRQLADGLTKKKASAWIEKLLSLPRKTSQFARRKELVPTVEQGYYAVEIDGVLKFFRVRQGKTDSRWAGFLFIDAGRGGPHEGLAWTSIKDVNYKVVIATTINADLEAAAKRFGQEIGRCGVCGRTLTDAISRDFGIGPICRAEKGW